MADVDLTQVLHALDRVSGELASQSTQLQSISANVQVCHERVTRFKDQVRQDHKELKETVVKQGDASFNRIRVLERFMYSIGGLLTTAGATISMFWKQITGQGG